LGLFTGYNDARSSKQRVGCVVKAGNRISSCVNEDGEEIYPRNWKEMGLVIPKVTKKKQRRPCFTVEVMNHLANSLTIKPQMRMFFNLCGASGLRVGEALGYASRRFSITAHAS
jgi:hypothetical protein